MVQDTEPPATTQSASGPGEDTSSTVYPVNPAGTSKAATTPVAAKTNLNTASAADLGKLPKIGASDAKAIVEARAKSKFKNWDDFVARHSRLFLHMARLVMPDRDGTMDAYAYLLEELRRDDFRALRAYTPDNRSRLTTWLAVIARRTSVDFYRRRYGRLRGEGRARHVQAARAALDTLYELWQQSGYGYKTRELELRLSRKISESIV